VLLGCRTPNYAWKNQLRVSGKRRPQIGLDRSPSSSQKGVANTKRGWSHSPASLHPGKAAHGPDKAAHVIALGLVAVCLAYMQERAVIVD